MISFNDSRMGRWIIVVGAALAMLAVMTGAFGAHGLKSLLDSYRLGIFETAVRYQMYHAIALVIVGLLGVTGGFSRRALKLSAMAFILGIGVFSGSLYLLALTGIRWVGVLTPFGGIAFIVGWLALISAALKNAAQNRQ